MRSYWTHSICSRCWDERHPGRVPVSVVPEYAQEEICCYCGCLHGSGTYVRDDPKNTPHCRHGEVGG